MQEYEYLVVCLENFTHSERKKQIADGIDVKQEFSKRIQDQLNSMASEGWRLKHYDNFVVVMERRKKG